MKWIPDRSGMFPKRLHFETLSELDEQCERLVSFVFFRRRGKKFEPPLDDDSLQVLVEEHADLDLNAVLPSDIEGETEFRPDRRPLIKINATITADPHRRNRVRTGIAHEWFHASHHARLWDLRWAKDRHAGRDGTLGRCRRETIIGAPDTDWVEFQAGYASCAILMPASWVERTVEAALAESLSTEYQLAVALAARFDVSTEAATWRLRQLGVPRRLREARQLDLLT